MMDIFSKFLADVDFYFSKNEIEEIDRLKTELDSAKAGLEIQSILSKDFEKRALSAEKTVQDYVTKDLEAKTLAISEDYWNNKYPKVNVNYIGRTFGPSKLMIPIDVKLLITPQDYNIHDILTKNNLYIKDKDYEKGVIKIYNWIKQNMYSYAYDEQVYGLPEFWEFPFEVIEGKRVLGKNSYDCDSWANLQASFYIAAGVPEYKVRVVIGNCALGGHSTVYVHSDVDNKFHHLNSTYGNGNYSEINKYYTTTDADLGTDKLGIKNIWFSFNNKFAWNKFTSAAKNEFKKESNDKYVIQ